MSTNPAVTDQDQRVSLTPEYLQGYADGVRPATAGYRYLRNPYDRRTRSGKHWDLGQSDGRADLGRNGADAANAYLARAEQDNRTCKTVVPFDIVVERIAKMLETGSGEPWNVTWARINRAAGMIVGICASEGWTTDLEASTSAQCFIDRIALAVDLPEARRVTLIKGLGMRVVRGLTEWYHDGVSR